MITVAILPSRNESATIAAVTAAVHPTPTPDPPRSAPAHTAGGRETCPRHTAPGARAATIALPNLARGTRTQPLAAPHRPTLASAAAVQINDTDPRNPDPT